MSIFRGGCVSKDAIIKQIYAYLGRDWQFSKTYPLVRIRELGWIGLHNPKFGLFLSNICFMGRDAKKKAWLLGLGCDSDGHIRITKGENFTILGGKEETHEAMTEVAIKINEKLAKKGKTLDSVSSEEFNEIAESVGLKPLNLPRAEGN